MWISLNASIHRTCITNLLLTRCNLSAGIGGNRVDGNDRDSSLNDVAILSSEDSVYLLRASLAFGSCSLKENNDKI